MIIYVEYHIPKDYFIRNKNAFQKLLNSATFKIAVMKFEKKMTYREIAKNQEITVIQVRKIISFVCGKLRDNGFKF